MPAALILSFFVTMALSFNLFNMLLLLRVSVCMYHKKAAHRESVKTLYQSFYGSAPLLLELLLLSQTSATAATSPAL